MKKEPDFSEVVDALGKAFTNRGKPDESDAEITDAILDFILEHERLRHRISASSAQARKIDVVTLKRLATWDSSDPSMSTIEKVFQRLAKGRGSDAVALLKATVEQKSLALSNAQKARASLPRHDRRQPMSALVEQIWLKDSSISENRLFHAICRQLKDMDDPPYNYSLNTFKARNPKHSDIPKTALRQYLYRAKKKLSP